jgi:hypothetical protein
MTSTATAGLTGPGRRSRLQTLGGTSYTPQGVCSEAPWLLSAYRPSGPYGYHGRSVPRLPQRRCAGGPPAARTCASGVTHSLARATAPSPPSDGWAAGCPAPGMSNAGCRSHRCAAGWPWPSHAHLRLQQPGACKAPCPPHAHVPSGWGWRLGQLSLRPLLLSAGLCALGREPPASCDEELAVAVAPC